MSLTTASHPTNNKNKPDRAEKWEKIGPLRTSQWIKPHTSVYKLHIKFTSLTALRFNEVNTLSLLCKCHHYSSPGSLNSPETAPGKGATHRLGGGDAAPAPTAAQAERRPSPHTATADPLCVHALWDVFGGQRTIFNNCFSSSAT